MKMIKITVLLVAGVSLAGCVGSKVDKTVDRGIDSKHLSQLVAGVWVDPNGCDHWIIDDGVEGYLSERMTPDGRPVCSGVAPPNTAVGPFKSGSSFFDPS